MPAKHRPRVSPPRVEPVRAPWWPFALAAVPAVIALAAIVVYQVDVPFQDSWELVPLLAQRAEGTLRLADLWTLHNEHRIVFPRLVMLGLAAVTGWSTFAECVVTWLLLVVLLGLFAALAAAAAQATGRNTPPWVVPAGAVIVFTLAQYENLLWGWQLSAALSVVGVVGALVMLTRPQLGMRYFGGALALAVLATYSFANGLLVWPMGLGLILIAPTSGGGRTRRAAFVAAWTVAGGLAVAAYLHGYAKPEGHPPFATAVIPLVRYVLAYVGEPLWFSAPAQWSGVLGVGLLAAATVDLIRRGTPAVALRAPLALAAYALGSALLTGIGRAEWGIEQAAASRYATFAIGIWLADVVLLGLQAQVLVAVGRRGPAQAAQAACLLVVVLFVCTSVRATEDMNRWWNAFTPARVALAKGPEGLDLHAVAFLHEKPTVLAERVATAKRLRVGPYRH